MFNNLEGNNYDKLGVTHTIIENYSTRACRISIQSSRGGHNFTFMSRLWNNSFIPQEIKRRYHDSLDSGTAPQTQC